MQFPPIVAHNLIGKSFNLPIEFEGEYNLLVLSFYDYQPSQIDPWLEFGKILTRNYQNFKYYALPVNNERHAFEQRIFNMSLRIHVPDPMQRAITIVLYANIENFCEALEIASRREIYTLLVNKQGEVLWRAEGNFSALRGVSLEETVETVLA